jgi:hypothetical protein
LKFRAQLHVILDDTVMNDDHPAVGAHMRMGVPCDGSAMGCPARVANSQRNTVGRPEQGFEFAQPSLDFFDTQLSELRQKGHASTVIPSVFELSEPR